MSDIVITEQQIKGWIKRRAELKEKIQEYGTEISLLESRLKALELFGGETEKTPVVATFVVNIDGPTVPDVIYNILFRAQRKMSPKEIRGEALKTNFPVEKWGKNFAYLYTALKRLVDSNRIHKDGGRYYLPLPAVERTEMD